MQLHFRSFGSGPPLIILHGLFGSLDNWHSVCLRLASQFQVFAVDQRNHGDSPHSPEMSYPLMAEDLDELMRASGLSQAHVLGHSMGGKTAMQFALTLPERVQTLVVVDMAPHAYPPRHERVISALLKLELSAAKSRRQLEQALAPEIPDLATRQFLLKSLKRNPDGSFQWRLGLEEIRSNYARLGAAVSSGAPFRGPTLFVRGEHSDYLGAGDLPVIRKLFPRSEMVTVSRAGHLPHVENPTEFLNRLNTFWSPQFYR